MSHIVTIVSKVRDQAAVSAACRRLGLAEPVWGVARLFADEAKGLLVQFPGWRYPAVLDLSTGEVRYDHFNGTWGDQVHLDHFLQAYAVELTKQEARKKGYQVTEQALQDGSIKVQLLTRA